MTWPNQVHSILLRLDPGESEWLSVTTTLDGLLGHHGLRCKCRSWHEWNFTQEIIFACAKGFSLQLVQGQHQQQVKLEVSVIQIDNQLRFAVYPVLLSSTYPHGKLDVVEGIARTGRELKPSEGASLTLLIAKWRRPAGSVDCFQCISLRLVHLHSLLGCWRFRYCTPDVIFVSFVYLSKVEIFCLASISLTLRREGYIL